MATDAAQDRRSTRRPPVPHPTVAERTAAGQAARAETPRSAHAAFEVGPDRADPVALLERQAESRVPELVPIRYGRMAASPFAFFRGGALIMASDLATTPTTGLRVQLCGDAHLANFGVFGTPERRLVFDINDFDETLPGPFEWDVKRLAASLEIAGRHRGFTDSERGAVVRAAVLSYRTATQAFAEQTNLAVYYASLDVDRVFAEYRATIPAKLVRRADRMIAKTRTRDSLQAFDRLAQAVDGELRIISDPPLLIPVRDLLPPDRTAEFTEWLRERIRDYRRSLETDRRRLLERYRVVDLARKVVGVGSVGTRAWIALMMGRDNHDPLFLQFKEAQPSVLEGFVGRSEYRNAGHRVVAGQRLMQATSDILLGWLRVGLPWEGAQERDFYVRQLRDWKGSIDLEAMVPKGMEILARLCGWTLARAHACSGDPVAIAAYLGRKDTFDRAIAAFAAVYADQNERDHAALVGAITGGRLTATAGI